jgi:protein-tyrosine phosphatase
MIKRFIKVNDKLYRGGAPSVSDVVNLHKHFGIKKIVSLDGLVGNKIDRITKLLGINHIIIPLDANKIEPLAQLTSYNLYDLLMKGGPTYVHCLEGKDRTGMVIAMFKCKFMNVSCQDAIQEAKSIGFGFGLHPQIKHFYEKIIRLYCECDKNVADDNNADIVDHTRESNSDWRGSVLDEADMKSFAPFFDTSRQYPYNSTYDYKYDQYPTRDNFDLEKVKEDKGRGTDVPLVGLYDNDSGMKGIGPVDMGGGWVNN